MKKRRSSMDGMRSRMSRLPEPLALDEHDRAILVALRRDARTSQRGLAREVGISAPAVADRLSRLEEAGVIRGYRVEVDWALLGYGMVVMVGMRLSQAEDAGRVTEELLAVPELERLDLVSGPSDFIGRFRLRDHGDLRALLVDRLWPIPGLQHIETYLSLSEMINTADPIDLPGDVAHPPSDTDSLA